MKVHYINSNHTKTKKQVKKIKIEAHTKTEPTSMNRSEKRREEKEYRQKSITQQTKSK